MPVMICLFEGCGQSLSVPTHGTGPVVLPPCPTCGLVNVWPPTDPRNQKQGWPKTPAAIASGAVAAAHVTEDCPGCRRPLRLPLAQAGKNATCPRCRTKFAWNPGQEVEGFEGRCSRYIHDDEDFSLILQRPKGSSGSFRLHKVEKGTGGIDRLAGGANHDAISEHGRIDYNRTRRAITHEKLNTSGFRCPWCHDDGLFFCGCGAVLCQGGQRGEDIWCPACERTRYMQPVNPHSTVKTRGASYTPHKNTISGTPRAAVDTNQERKRLGR